MDNKKLQVWLPLLFSIIMVAGMVAGYKLRENTNVSGFFTISKKSPLQEVLDIINLKYVDNVGTDTLTNNLIQEILHKLDPHSSFIPSNKLNNVNDDLRGNFGGIGVEFQLFNDTVNVLNVISEGPSDKAGLKVGDKIIAVNDTINITGKSINPDKIRDLLRGDRNTTVNVTLFRNGKTEKTSITRGIITVPSVDVAYMLNAETGFIHINKFSENTFREFMKAMEKLKEQKIKKLILDLRGNGGGLLSQAVNIADEFIDGNKLIVYTEGAHAERKEFRAMRDGIFEEGELVLLVDEYSASASEVLAGALQDWDRATIIGRRTFGKGLVQEQFGLSDGSALRLTVARYYSPLGRNIQKPFTKGYEKYEEEITDRFHTGEVLQGDTSKNAGPAYKTPKGHLVYGGGGITPDVYVPFDTSSMSKTLIKLYSKAIFSNFLYKYYIRNKAELDSFKSPEAFADGFTKTGEVFNELAKFAAADSVNLSNISVKEKESILRRIPSVLARQIWRYEGFFKVYNRKDEFLGVALKQLGN